MHAKARIQDEMKIQHDSQIIDDQNPTYNTFTHKDEAKDPNRGIHFHTRDPLSRMTNKEKQFFLPYLPQPKIRTLKQTQKQVATPQTSTFSGALVDENEIPQTAHSVSKYFSEQRNSRNFP